MKPHKRQWEFSPARRALPDYGDRPAQPTLVPGPMEPPSSPLTEDDTPFSSSDDNSAETDVDAMTPTFQEDVYFEERESFTGLTRSDARGPPNDGESAQPG